MYYYSLEIVIVRSDNMNIIKAFGTTNTDYYSKTLQRKYIVLHYTAGTRSVKGSARNVASMFKNAFIDKLPEDYIRIIGYICVGLLIVFIRFIVFIKLKLKGGFGLLNFEIFFSWIFIYFYAVDISSTIFNVFSTEFSEIFSYLLILIFVIILICSEIYLRYGVRSKVKIKDKNNIILLIVKIFFLSCLGVILFYIFH